MSFGVLVVGSGCVVSSAREVMFVVRSVANAVAYVSCICGAVIIVSIWEGSRWC